MPEVTVSGTFSEQRSARAAAKVLADRGLIQGQLEIGPAGAAAASAEREAGFLRRFVVVVVLWSVVGTATGAAFGAVLSYTFGPHGTDGLILQVVSWAVFAHVLIGLWAGYVLLADRTEREVLPTRCQLILVIDGEQASQVTEALRGAGAVEVRVDPGRRAN